MELVLKEIKEEELPVLQNLFEFVAYDLSEFNKSNIKPSGMFEPKISAKELYNDKNFYIFLIRVEDQIAGFIIVKYLPEEEIYYLNHFLY
ncbi:hypothetical protein [Cohnella sp. AR92]|uniref:hypothetical protein n=1 Tax=Cohnella sp. AR92 TaxID=648716 RepID=UPI000F8D5702|nr:hypothetical protein [Cohnella sp. AR92]RUS45852.1 hypothetical protein ELR57_18550 [Cohnella sp. AR92]